MQNEIWLLAKLFSLEQNASLTLFFQILEELKNSEKLFSIQLLGKFPELALILRKYTHSEMKAFQANIELSALKGYCPLYPGHELYPQQFVLMPDPPFLLRMQGSPVWLTNQGLSVVGSREPSMASRNWMDEQLGTFLKNNSAFTVSGGARGVDQKAHWISLLHGRPTVVFVPSGLDQIYPSTLLEWRVDVLSSGGAFVSEYEDAMPMRKHYFVQRNRLISALGCLTLIVEARRRSGTFITAKQALEQQRPLLILPGHPCDPQFMGSLDLLRDGGTPIADAQDLEMIFNAEVQTLSCFQHEMYASLVANRQRYH